MYYRNDTNAVIEDNAFAHCDCGQSRAVKIFDYHLMEDVVIVTCDRCHENASGLDALNDAEILKTWGDDNEGGIYYLNGAAYEIDAMNNVREYEDKADHIYKIVAPNGEVVGYEATREEAEKKAREMQGDDILNETQCDYWVTWDE
jgi:hypothetical protein